MSTFSRYDFMDEGTVQDPITKSFYPDPLTMNYLNLKIKSAPLRKKLKESDIYNFVIGVDQVYGSPIFDDVLLTLNGYAHKNFLKIGDNFYYPSLSDIQQSFKKER